MGLSRVAWSAVALSSVGASLAYGPEAPGDLLDERNREHARLLPGDAVRVRGHFPAEQAALNACTSPSTALTRQAAASNAGATAGS